MIFYNGPEVIVVVNATTLTTSVKDLQRLQGTATKTTFRKRLATFECRSPIVVAFQRRFELSSVDRASKKFVVMCPKSNLLMIEGKKS